MQSVLAVFSAPPNFRGVREKNLLQSVTWLFTLQLEITFIPEHHLIKLNALSFLRYQSFGMIRQPELKVHIEENDIMGSIQAGKICSIYFFPHDWNPILFMVTGSNQHHSVAIIAMALQTSKHSYQTVNLSTHTRAKIVVVSIGFYSRYRLTLQ